MKIEKRVLLGLMIAGALAAGLTSSALANNDGQAPGNDCSLNPVAIGQPGLGGIADDAEADLPFDGITNAVDIGPSPVSAGASAMNPGQSTGALGQQNFNGGTRC